MLVLPTSELCSTYQQLYQNPQHRHTLTESSPYVDRLALFTEWPHTLPTPQDLARAGFSHTPTNEHPDNVVCNSCKDFLCDWQPEHDPRIQLHIHHYRCSQLWMVLATADRKKPSAKDMGFFDPSLQQDFPELCLFQNVNTFCDRVKRCKFDETDILELLPKCLRGEALTWLYSQSKHRYLAVCLAALRARFPQALPQEAPQASPQKAPQPMESAYQAPEYHHCKLCNASFSSMTRLIQHAQENVCNKPRCRHCEMVFSSKNRLHQHLRKECQKQVHRKSSSRCSSSCSFASSPTPQTPPPVALPEENRVSPPTSPSPSPPPTYQAISPSPPAYLTMADLSARYAEPRYLKMDDLFRMFGPYPASTKSSITITIDDPFVRPFVSFKKSIGSTQEWQLGIATSYHQNLRAQCFPPHIAAGHHHRPPSLNTGNRQAMPNPA